MRQNENEREIEIKRIVEKNVPNNTIEMTDVYYGLFALNVDNVGTGAHKQQIS